MTQEILEKCYKSRPKHWKSDRYYDLINCGSYKLLTRALIEKKCSQCKSNILPKKLYFNVTHKTKSNKFYTKLYCENCGETK